MRILSPLVPGLASALLLFLPSGAEAANLLKNPGFETGNFKGWVSDSNAVVTSTPLFLPETILTGKRGARIFPVQPTAPPPAPNPILRPFRPPNWSSSFQLPQPILLSQQFTIPEGADRLRFGGNLRFFSLFPFENNLDRGFIWLVVSPELSIALGTQANGLSSTLASNKVSRVSDWLLFEQVVDVSGLGGQTAFLRLGLVDVGRQQDTAVAFDDLFAEVVPIPTPALLPGLVGMGIAAYRRRVGKRSI